MSDHRPSCRIPWFVFACLATVVGLLGIIQAIPRSALEGEPPAGKENLARTTRVAFEDQQTSNDEFVGSIRDVLKDYCFECHNAGLAEAEINLERYRTERQAANEPEVWIRVAEMLETHQMPPPDSAPLKEVDEAKLKAWINSLLKREAARTAGDPGPVILRRLSNAEYTYTIQDLTGLSEIDPAAEFPIDGAAGEGFTNAGAALVMSPSLVTKYLEAAKAVANHAVLLPDGIEFSSTTTRRDWTDHRLQEIKNFYRRFGETTFDADRVLQGISIANDRGIELDVERYLTALSDHKVELLQGEMELEDVAKANRLNPKYLRLLWEVLTTNDTASSGSVPSPSLLLNRLRHYWRNETPDALPEMVREIRNWQELVWQFNPVGQIGREKGPQQWQQPVNPIHDSRQIRLALAPIGNEPNSMLVLRSGRFSAASKAEMARNGLNESQDYVVWENARIELPGRPAIPLQWFEAWRTRIAESRLEAIQRMDEYLQALAPYVDEKASDRIEKTNQTLEVTIAEVAKTHQLDPVILKAWCQYLNLAPTGAVLLDGKFEERLQTVGGYEGVDGWGSADTPIVLGNRSDSEYAIPGRSRPHRVVVHPSPTDFVAVGWQASVSGRVSLKSSVIDAHGCGNGVEWWLVHHRGSGKRPIGHGTVDINQSDEHIVEDLEISAGEVISLVIGPRDQNHACDLTEIELAVRETAGDRRTWQLSGEVADRIQESNPLPDSYGNEMCWTFYRGNVARFVNELTASNSIPSGSLLDRWIKGSNAERIELVSQQVELMNLSKEATDVSPENKRLRDQLETVVGAYRYEPAVDDLDADPRFGQVLGGLERPHSHLVVPAGETVSFRIPVDWSEATFVADVRSAPSNRRPIFADAVITSDRDEPVVAAPILATKNYETDDILASLEDFRQLFPRSLCYTKLVPTDEVVTLLLFYREDEALQRLMLNEVEIETLDRLWDELFFVAQEPLQLADSHEQLYEFATQDRPDLVVEFEAMREEIQDRADAFRERLQKTESLHVEAVLQFAAKAWRKEITDEQASRLKALYHDLRFDSLSHVESIRLMLARVLTSPEFLYRLEHSPEGSGSSPVSEMELATRLSYFLVASLPDQELRELAERGELRNSLATQANRLLRHEDAQRLAIHFACQWLHIRDFDQTVEKNERLYPEYQELKADFYEETVRFLTDLIQRDASILTLLDADHSFLNAELAEFYGLPWQTQVGNDQDVDWQRVVGMREAGRGGVLGMATILASQSGASRSSPILRGNWIYETLLGKRLPRPPANVPQLPDEAPIGLTSRELIERHSQDESCATCHQHIDPMGFALEQFDAVGRRRSEIANTKAALENGDSIEGLGGLQRYLLTQRRDEFVRQFCRKLLGYALGRSVQLSDEPLLDEMQRKLSSNNYRFSVAVETILMSRQFQEIRGRDFENAAESRKSE